MADRPTLVVIGAASRDIDAGDPRGWRLGGTVTYAAITAATLGVRTRALIGVDERAAEAEELEVLRRAGVEVRLAPLANGPVFDNRETESGRVQHVLSASDVLPVSALPAEWRNPGGAILGSVAGELNDEWAAAFGTNAIVALAAQGLVRTLVPGRAVQHVSFQRSPLTDRADAIFISAEDIAAGAPPLRELLLRPNQTLLVTHGDRGALHLRFAKAGVTGRFAPPNPPRHAIDTTGAGDTFLAAWLATRLLIGPSHDWRTLAVASAAASLSVERQRIADHPTKRELCSVLAASRGWSQLV